MKNLHKFFQTNSPMYAKWHKHPDRSRYHFMVFMVIVAILFVSVLVGIDKDITITLNISDASNSRQAVQPNQQLSGLTTALLQAAKRYQISPTNGLRTALDALTAATISRQALVQRLMIEDPQQVVLQAIPENISAQLPTEIQALIEQEVEKSGRLTVLHSDYASGNHLTKSEFKYILEVNDEEGKTFYYLHFANGQPAPLTGAEVKVKGILLNREIALDAAGGSSLQTTSTATSALSGDQKTLAILINFTDNTSQQFSTGDVSNLLFNNPDSTNAYYAESSFGSTTFSGQAVGWYTIPYSAGNCDYYGYATAADSAASRAGVNLSNYGHKVYIFPSASCGWAGLGEVGGTRTWIASTAGYVMTHELGHNLSMRHAASMSCGGVQIGTNCSYSEYGDPYDDMGASWINRQNGAPHKSLLGWGRTQSVTSSGTYTIYPTETSTTNTQFLKIPRTSSGDNLFVEYRQPIGFDTSMAGSMWEGVGILLGTSGGPDSFRLDMSPDGDFNNSALVDGGVFTDSTNGISVTQLSHTATSATVQVSINGAPCTPSNPGVRFGQASLGGQAGQSVAYQVTVSNTDSSTCGSTTFALSASVPAGWSATFGQGSGSSLLLSPGQSSTVTLNVTPPVGTADGAYSFSLQATDVSNGSHAGAGSGTYNLFTIIPDTTAPTVIVTSPVNGSKITAANVTMAANANDNIKVTKVEFYLDNVLQGADAAAPYSFKWNTKKTSAGAHTITAKAYDAAGNTASNSVTISK